MSAVALLGATGTIGRTLAKRLAAAGRTVVLVGRNEEKLRPLAEELDRPFVVADGSDSGRLEAGLKEASDAVGGYSALVNCVGSLALKPAHLTGDAEFREVVETNLFTAFATVRVGANLLRERGGAIVLFSSAAAEIGIHNHEAIAAAKAGVVGLARSAAATYAATNIRVNVVSLGLTRTDLTRRIWESPPVAAASAQRHALGRIGEPEHAASLVAWLLDDENDWITGQVIGLDGGLSRVLPKK